MNIKVAAFTVSEKSINTFDNYILIHGRILRIISKIEPKQH